MSTGTYAAYHMEKKSRERLFMWSKNLGLDVQPPEDLHCTVVYSRKRVDDIHDAISTVGCHIIGKPLKFEILGTALAIIINCKEAVVLNTTMIEMGCTSDYPSYIPHVTIVRDFKGTEVPTELPSFNFVFDRLIVEDLDLDK